MAGEAGTTTPGREREILVRLREGVNEAGHEDERAEPNPFCSPALVKSPAAAGSLCDDRSSMYFPSRGCTDMEKGWVS